MKTMMNKYNIIKGLTGLDIGIRCGDEIDFTRIKGAIYESGPGNFRLFRDFGGEITLSWTAAEELLTKGSCYDGLYCLYTPEEHDLTQMTIEEAKEYLDKQKPDIGDIIRIVKSEPE